MMEPVSSQPLFPEVAIPIGRLCRSTKSPFLLHGFILLFSLFPPKPALAMISEFTHFLVFFNLSAPVYSLFFPRFPSLSLFLFCFCSSLCYPLSHLFLLFFFLPKLQCPTTIQSPKSRTRKSIESNRMRRHHLQIVKMRVFPSKGWDEIEMTFIPSIYHPVPACGNFLVLSVTFVLFGVLPRPHTSFSPHRFAP